MKVMDNVLLEYIHTHSPIKLNLGCGYDIKDEYINVDRCLESRLAHLPILVGCDVLDFMHQLPPGAASDIHSKFLFEHLSPNQIDDLIYNCYLALNRQGIMVIIVDNYLKIAESIISLDKDFDYNKYLREHIYLFADEVVTTHKSIWTPNIAKWWFEKDNHFKTVVEVSADGRYIGVTAHKIAEVSMLSIPDIYQNIYRIPIRSEETNHETKS